MMMMMMMMMMLGLSGAEDVSPMSRDLNESSHGRRLQNVMTEDDYEEYPRTPNAMDSEPEFPTRFFEDPPGPCGLVCGDLGSFDHYTALGSDGIHPWEVKIYTRESPSEWKILQIEVSYVAGVGPLSDTETVLPTIRTPEVRLSGDTDDFLVFENEYTLFLGLENYITEVTLRAMPSIPDTWYSRGFVRGPSSTPITGIELRTMKGTSMVAGCFDDFCGLPTTFGGMSDENGIPQRVMAFLGQVGYFQALEYDELTNYLVRYIGGDPIIIASLAMYFGPCRLCPSGKFIDLVTDNGCTCQDCPADQISTAVNQKECRGCGYRSFPNADQTECFSCPAGYYHDPLDRATCLPCSPEADPVDLTKHQFDPQNVGIASLDECRCRDGYSGDDCTFVECPSTLNFVSLGLLLIEASLPPEIRPDGGDRETRELDSVGLARQIEATLRNANTEDDDSLSVAELLTALLLADVVIQDTNRGRPVELPIWAQPSSGRNAWTSYGEEDITIPEIVTNAVASFVETGTFYWRMDSAADVITMTRHIPIRRPAGTKRNARLTSIKASKSSGPTTSTRRPRSSTGNVPMSTVSSSRTKPSSPTTSSTGPAVPTTGRPSPVTSPTPPSLVAIIHSCRRTTESVSIASCSTDAAATMIVPTPIPSPP